MLISQSKINDIIEDIQKLLKQNEPVWRLEQILENEIINVYEGYIDSREIDHNTEIENLRKEIEELENEIDKIEEK